MNKILTNNVRRVWEEKNKADSWGHHTEFRCLINWFPHHYVRMIIRGRSRTWTHASESTSGDLSHSLIRIFCLIVTQIFMSWKYVANKVNFYAESSVCLLHCAWSLTVPFQSTAESLDLQESSEWVSIRQLTALKAAWRIRAASSTPTL